MSISAHVLSESDGSSLLALYGNAAMIPRATNHFGQA